MSTDQDLIYRETSKQGLDKDLRDKGLFPDLLREQQENVQDEQYHNHLTDGKDHLRVLLEKGVGAISLDRRTKLRPLEEEIVSKVATKGT